jgi:hypothetical protein
MKSLERGVEDHRVLAAYVDIYWCLEGSGVLSYFTWYLIPISSMQAKKKSSGVFRKDSPRK